MTTALWILLGVAALVLVGTGILQALLKLAFTMTVRLLTAVVWVLGRAMTYILTALGFIVGGMVWLLLTILPYRRQTVYNAFQKAAADFIKILKRVYDLEQRQSRTDRNVESLKGIWSRINEVDSRINDLADTVGLEDDGDGGFNVSTTDGELAKINDGFEALCTHLGVVVHMGSDGTYQVQNVKQIADDKAKAVTKAKRRRR